MGSSFGARDPTYHHKERWAVSTEWLDPSRQEDDLKDVVLRLRHEAAYVFAKQWAEDARVVDVACGVAYGARVLGSVPSSYLGLDRAKEALIAAVQSNCGSVSFVCADAVRGIPVSSGSVDVVLAYQILEHIPVEDTEDFLGELRRICSPGGRVILTTPNRRHRLLPLQRPWNPYHVREFRRQEFANLLGECFSDITVLGLRAGEKIERVELERVRQNPLAVYAGPLRELIPDGALRWIGARLLSWDGPAGTSDGETSPPGHSISVQDFWIEEDREGKGLDLVAVCRP